MTDRTVVRAGHLLDVRAGGFVADRALVVEDGRVAAVLAGADAPSAAETASLDLRDLWVVPGLIDCHTHLVGDVQEAGVPATTTSNVSKLMHAWPIANSRIAFVAARRLSRP